MSHTLRDLRDAYLRYLDVERGAAPWTLVSYRKDFLDLSRSISLETPLEALTLDQLRRWLESQKARGLKPATRRRRLITIRRALGWAVREGWLTTNVATRLDMPKRPNPVVQVPDAQTVRAFLQDIRHSGQYGLRDQALFSLIYATAIRAEELITARLADVDLANRLLHVVGKGRKARLVPFDAETKALLEEYLATRPDRNDPTRPLFTSQRAQPFTYSGLRNVLKRHTARLGISWRVWVHGLRHARATHLYAATRDLLFIRDLLGHANVSTTQIYVHAAGLIREQYDRAHAVLAAQARADEPVSAA